MFNKNSAPPPSKVYLVNNKVDAEKIEIVPWGMYSKAKVIFCSNHVLLYENVIGKNVYVFYKMLHFYVYHEVVSFKEKNGWINELHTAFKELNKKSNVVEPW